MIIDWTYGAIAQLQGYFTTGTIINNSSIVPSIIIIGCLKIVLSSKAPMIRVDGKQPTVEIDSKRPFIKFEETIC